MRKNSFMKKLTAFILAGMLLLLTGCQGKLSDKFDEEEVKNAAKDIVTQVNEGNVESVYNDIFQPCYEKCYCVRHLAGKFIIHLR